MPLPATKSPSVSFDVQPRPGPESVLSHGVHQSPLPSPPGSRTSTPTGYRTPTGYQTSAPSSLEGSPIPRRKCRPTKTSTSRKEEDAAEMVEVSGSETGKGGLTWRSRKEAPNQRAVPPWAEPDAQPPPPPSQLYANLTPPTSRRTMKPASPLSSATDTNPTPKHFNIPTAGASPVMVRRSLFRTESPARAKSVDSLTRSVPWAERKLRATPRTDSPSRAASKTEAPSWAIPRTDAPTQQAARTEGAPSSAPAQQKAAPSPASVQQRAAPSPAPAQQQAAPSPAPAQQQAAPSPAPAQQRAAPSPAPAQQRAAPSPAPAQQQAAPSPAPAQQQAARTEKQPQSVPKMYTPSQATPGRDVPLQKGSSSKASFRSEAMSSSFSHEMSVSEKVTVSSRHQSEVMTRTSHATTDSSATQCTPRDPPWGVHGGRDTGGGTQPQSKAGQGASKGQGAPRPQTHSQATGQMTHRPHGSSDAPRHSPGMMVSAKAATEGQSAPGNLTQEQSSPTPWRKTVSQVAGAKAAPSQQPSHKDDASVASGSAEPSAASPASREGQVPNQTLHQGPQQAPWRRTTGTVEQAPAVTQASPEPNKSEPNKSHVTGSDKHKKETVLQASSAAQVADSQPSWRKQNYKSRQAAASTAAAAPTQPPASTTPLGKTSQQVTVTPASNATTVNKSIVTAPAGKSTSLTPAVHKPASPVPSAADKPASPVPPAANKPASPVPPANKPVSPANKPVSPTPPANKPVSPVPPANKPVSPVPPANKPAFPLSITTSKLGSPVHVLSKSVTSLPAATSPIPTAVSPVPIAIGPAPVVPSAGGLPISAPSPPQVSGAAETLEVAAAEAQVCGNIEARRATSQPLAPPHTTTHSPTPPLPPKQTAAAIVSAPTVPQAPKPAVSPVQPIPSAPVTVQPSLAAQPTLAPASGLLTVAPTPTTALIASCVTETSPSEIAATTVTTPQHAMPIPTPPPVPDAKFLKSGGQILTSSSVTATQGISPATAQKHTAISSQLEESPKEPATGMKPPQPEFPPPPPVDQIEVLPGSSELDPGLPPPPSFTQEERAASSLGITTRLQDLVEQEGENLPSPEYVRESVTKRIKAFEKQASKEEEPPIVERQVPVARPVAPWVKKTSSGLVHQDRYWDMTSPEEPDVIWPSPPPPQQKETERTKSPSIPAPSSSPLKAPSAIPVAPPPKAAAPAVTPGPKVSPLPVTASKVVPPRVRPRLPRERSVSVGDYHAHYITPDELPLVKMPAEGATTDSSPEHGKTAPVKGDPPFDPWCDPKNPRVISFQDVSAAAFKIKSGIMNTPCTKSHMSSFTDMEIFFKKEFNQYTGSFKERGARYTLLMLSEEQQKKGVIAASAGNHALALSYHGQDLGIPVTVVMPLVAPIMKVQACRQYGANIIVKGNDIGECREYALKIAQEQGLLYINGYDHPHILAGQGTMGLEIVEQVPNIDAVVIPVGGGGLIAGVALAVKALYPHVQVIGVESEKCASFSAAMKAGRPVYVKAESTLADGLAVPMVGINAFATASKLVDKVVTVREEWIAISILRLVECEKAVVEGAGATALAAILAGELPELKGKRVVIPLCGGNIDTTVLGRCLERGLAADGRLVKFTVTVSDRPGGIAELTRLLANLGVSIKDMVHERAWIRSDIFSVEVKVLCETRDRDHSEELRTALLQRYKILRFGTQSTTSGGSQ
ncbi:nascent polypeptide-associated complex subunit alpha, muscle-specific form-like isoform X2 [Homarus americanus]|uniref:nascent polypeptide-associated complex subunit alpha, muscle-specific form-like isoform X2 n=1 Tax=Homarus americanus TaxID=6706 RepID=UPI001C475DF0|nr:nascent polypeptide-associated complex subunit alpha, muscle-specific form-like isoform X2 [Homarus americanus]